MQQGANADQRLAALSTYTYYPYQPIAHLHCATHNDPGTVSI